MKKQLLFSIICLLLHVSIINGNSIQAFLATGTFNIPGKGPYLETYLTVNGKGVTYLKKVNGKFQSAVEITIIIKKDSTRVYADRYNLLSPEIVDTIKDLKDFIDQQRIPLANGDYDLTISIVDKNKRENPYKGTTKIHINYPDNAPVISEIELLESFTKTVDKNILSKSGYDLTPFITNYYSRYTNSLKFYAEIYNTKLLKGDKYIVNYYIEQANTKRKVPDFNFFIKETPQDINVVLADIPIDSLPSGNYNLVVEVRNHKDEMMAYKDYFFQRNNPMASPTIKLTDYMGININNTFVANYNNRDTLYEMILTLRPISNQNENDFTETYFNKEFAARDSLLMKKYFYDFWSKRNAQNPKEAWEKYREEVIKVNKMFGTAFRKGYDTDRGRVYLQYGPPNIITNGNDDPAALPYIIWQYYVIKDQTNRKFLFYEPNEGNNEFVLLHSDVKGEISSADWQVTLYKRSFPGNNNVDATKVPDRIGGRAIDIFTNPR